MAKCNHCKHNPCQCGRPTVMTEDRIAKLEHGFLRGYTDLEACLYADISKDTLYLYQTKNPEFINRKELLKQNIKVVAKNALFDELEEGNAELGLKTLERLDKANWSTRTETRLEATHNVKTFLEELEDTE